MGVFTYMGKPLGLDVVLGGGVFSLLWVVLLLVAVW